MTASLQGKIEIQSDSINDALKRINDLNNKLKEITAATKAFERAEKSYNATTDATIAKLKQQVSASKEQVKQARAKAKANQDAVKVAKEQIRAETQANAAMDAHVATYRQLEAEERSRNALLVNNTKLITAQQNKIADLTQAVKQSNLGDRTKNGLLSTLASTMRDYSAAVQKAEGDVVELTSAGTTFDLVTRGVSRSLKEKTAAIKEANAVQDKSRKLMVDNATLTDAARNRVAALEQRIGKANLERKDEVRLTQQVNDAYGMYAAAVQKAEGDTVALKDAKRELNNAISSARRGVLSFTVSNKDNQSQLIRNEQAIGSLTLRYQQSAAAIKTTTLSQQEQERQLKILEQNFERTKNTIKEYGAGTLEAVRANNAFRQSLVRSSDELRKNLAGVGRGAGQAGIQVQQFVGQIQGGIDPMIALSQQSADLGWALGMPLAGAIAGIAFSMGTFLAPSMFDGKDAMEEFTEALEKLKAESVSVQGDVYDLSQEILELSKTSIDTARLKAQLNFEDTKDQAKKSLNVIKDQLGSIVSLDFSKYDELKKKTEEFTKSIIESGNTNARVTDESVIAFGNLRLAIGKVANTFGVSGKNAEDFGLTIAKAYQELGKEPSPDAIVKFTTTLVGLRSNFGELTKEGRETLDTLIKNASKAEELGRIMEVLGLAVGGSADKLRELAYTSDIEDLTSQNKVLQLTLEGNEDAAFKLQKALDFGATSFDELPEKLREAILNQENYNKLLEEMNTKGNAQKQYTTQLEKLRQNLAVMSEQMSNGEEAAFKLQKAFVLGKKSFSELSSENKALVLSLYDAEKATKDLNESEQKRIKSAESLINVTQTYEDLTAKLSVYNKNLTDDQRQLALEEIKRESNLSKMTKTISSLTQEDLKRLATIVKVSTEEKSYEEILKDVTKAFGDQTAAMSEAEAAARRLSSIKSENLSFGMSLDLDQIRSMPKGVKEAYGRIFQAEQQALMQGLSENAKIIMEMEGLTAQQRSDLLVAQSAKVAEAVNQIHEQALIVSGGYWQQWLQQARDNMNQTDAIVGDALNSFTSDFGQGFADVLFEGASAAETLSNVFKNVASSIVAGIAEMAAQWVVYNTVESLAKKQSAASSAAMLSTQAAAMSAMAGLNAYASAAAVPVTGYLAAPGAASAAITTTGTMAATVASLMSSAVGFKTGGYVSGPGSSTSDSIPARLSNGEYVINAAATRMLGTDVLDQLNKGQMPMLASGGFVGTNSASGGNFNTNITVELINQSSSNVEVGGVEQFTDQNGEPKLRAYIRDVVRTEMNNGQFDKVLKNNYGQTRKPIRR